MTTEAQRSWISFSCAASRSSPNRWHLPAGAKTVYRPRRWRRNTTQIAHWVAEAAQQFGRSYNQIYPVSQSPGTSKPFHCEAGAALYTDIDAVGLSLVSGTKFGGTSFGQVTGSGAVWTRCFTADQHVSVDYHLGRSSVFLWKRLLRSQWWQVGAEVYRRHGRD